MTLRHWDKVHTVADYCDGPILGIADRSNVPHLYEKRFSGEADEYVDRYRIMPIDRELFSLLMEQWEIFIRWQAAFDQGRATMATHSALPEDRDRMDQLTRLIGDGDKPDPARSEEIGAEFRRTGPEQHAFEVRWLD
jgi:hypothetical protein